MALVRRSRKRMSLKKRSSRRLIRKPRVMLTQGKVYSFKRTCALAPYNFVNDSWVQAATNEITNDSAYTRSSGIFKFKLNDLPGATDFTNMFEQFKITGVKLKFMPTIGTESNPNYTGTVMEPLATAIDRGANDLVVAGPSFSSLLENQDVKLRNSQKPFSVYIGSPTFHQPADAASQVTYRLGWLDSELSTSRDVDAHGLKYAFPATRSATNAIWYRVYATYYIKCRGPQ